MVRNIFELRSLLLKTKNSKLAALAEKKSRQGIWREYFDGRRAVLFHGRYKVVDELADASIIPAEVLDVLERPVLLSAKLFQTIFDLVMSTIPGKEALKEDENRKLWNMIVNHSLESINKVDINARKAWYSCTKQL